MEKKIEDDDALTADETFFSSRKQLSTYRGNSVATRLLLAVIWTVRLRKHVKYHAVNQYFALCVVILMI